MNRYYIYILSNASRMIYVGLTTDLDKIVQKHREKKMSSFKANFSFEKLVYVEETTDIHHAINREAELKGFPRNKKQDLISITNPGWQCIGSYWMKETA
jgi:putative endonuclease